MASNGVILLNLGNRNAAEFQRLSVPDSYEKASGALTAGTYVTVYKWLYQGFMLAPSLCDAVDATDHINLVDRTNGGIIKVYPDDTVTVEGGVSPGPSPEPSPTTEEVAVRVTIGENSGTKSLLVQFGTASSDGTFTPGERSETITTSNVMALNLGPYLIDDFFAVSYRNDSSESWQLWLATALDSVQIWLGSEIGWNWISRGWHPSGINSNSESGTSWFLVKKQVPVENNI